LGPRDPIIRYAIRRTLHLHFEKLVKLAERDASEHAFRVREIRELRKRSGQRTPDEKRARRGWGNFRQATPRIMLRLPRR
jgi:hypothetical protein